MVALQKKTRFEIPILSSPARKYISLKKNSTPAKICRFVIGFLSFFLLAGCGPSVIWNVPAEDLSLAIASGDTSYLKNLDPSENDLHEILQHGPGSAYFHAYLAREIGREELFGPLLEVEWHSGDSPWRLLAGETLCRYYIATGNYAGAESVASGLLEFEDAARYRFLHIEALYWQGRDAEVLDLLGNFDVRNSDGLDDFTLREIELFEAVSSTRLGRPGWKEMLLDLYREQPPSSLHYRALRFIMNDYEEAFSVEEMAFLNAVVAVADSRPHDAVPIFANLLTRRPDLYLAGAVYETAYAAFRFGGQAAAGARLFESLVERGRDDLTEEEFYSIYEKAALLHYYARDFTNAARHFEKALGHAGDRMSRERMRWYLLRNALSRSIDRALEMLPSAIKDYADPGYYSDIFNVILTKLVHLERWEDLIDFYGYSADRVSAGIKARTAYLCGAVLREGQSSTAGRPNVPARADMLFGEASVDGVGYYSLLSSASLGVLPGMLNIVEEPEVSSGEPTTQDFITAGFISYGLLDYAFRQVQENPESVSDRTLLDLSRALADSGDIYNSIRTIDFLKKRLSFQQTREALELSYPRAFRKEIEAFARRDGIPPYLLFALVREESYFKRDIVSRSGAVGLAQLMPATAADTAQRMGIELPPLTDPAGNISIGSYYLSQMLSRFEVPSNAVFAYNAGPTRMRLWKRQYAGFPEDLLLEALPIEETQNHGRKVFSSAIMYAYLYYGVSPYQVVDYYFDLTKEGN